MRMRKSYYRIDLLRSSERYVAYLAADRIAVDTYRKNEQGDDGWFYKVEGKKHPIPARFYNNEEWTGFHANLFYPNTDVQITLGEVFGLEETDRAAGWLLRDYNSDDAVYELDCSDVIEVAQGSFRNSIMRDIQKRGIVFNDVVPHKSSEATKDSNDYLMIKTLLRR